MWHQVRRETLQEKSHPHSAPISETGGRQAEAAESPGQRDPESGSAE